MDDNSAYFYLKLPFAEAIRWLIKQLRQAGFVVLRTFDLQSARKERAECACTDHGHDSWDCQMLVLLVYQSGQPPSTVIGRGDRDQAWFWAVETPQQPLNPHLVRIMRKLTTRFIYSPIPIKNNLVVDER
jgi:hypothetical protein